MSEHTMFIEESSIWESLEGARKVLGLPPVVTQSAESVTVRSQETSLQASQSERTAQSANPKIQEIIAKSQKSIPLTAADVALLLQAEDSADLAPIFEEARRIKSSVYGNRVVLFAPLYVSDFCKNNCTYCGYRRDNPFPRRSLSVQEIGEEVKLLEQMGHKRLALEVGEDHLNYPFESILEAIDTIYAESDIRRINVNIAPVSVEQFRELKKHEIGTYILFQETYLKTQYKQYHKQSAKGEYNRQLFAHHKAMEGGIDDVGGGVLFGLAPYQFEVMALFLHNQELERRFGVGFHTVSVPRLQKAQGMDLSSFEYLVSDNEFRKIVAVLRIAIPLTGIILSTRESVTMRQELINLGITQISAGSQTGVGAYKESQEDRGEAQFSVSDERTPLEVLKDLVKREYLPSYCTACYRQGRTGKSFMDIVRAGKIHTLCHPNALLTFAEYIQDYGDTELKNLASTFLAREVDKIENSQLKKQVQEGLEKINAGGRDIYV